MILKPYAKQSAPINGWSGCICEANNKRLGKHVFSAHRRISQSKECPVGGLQLFSNSDSLLF